MSMIFTELAANEGWSDSFLALRLLFQPWKWYRGKEQDNLKKLLERKFLPEHTFYFYLTGRAALYYLLQCLNLPKGTKVLVQSFTCEAVILPILANNLAPVYIDIERGSFSMNLTDLQKKITSETKVLILQHSFGITPHHRREILELAKEQKLVVIEDLAHGGDFKIFKNDRFKSIKLLSFGRSKAFSSVFGGALAVKDFAISQKIKKYQPTLSQPSFIFIIKCLIYKIVAAPIKATYWLYLGRSVQFILQKLQILIPEISNKEKNGTFDYLIAKAYPNALAALLLFQIKNYTNTVRMRKKAVGLYIQNFPPEAEATAQQLDSFSLIRYPLFIKNPDKMWQLARRKGIYLGKWYNQVVAPKEISLKKMKYLSESCPVAEEVSKTIINLPTNITEKDCRKVIKVVKNSM